MAIGSVYVAYWNVDGSFGRPKLAALVLGDFWSFWVFLALWLIVAYIRERLFVTPDAITQHGCIRATREEVVIQALCWLRDERYEAVSGIKQGLDDVTAGRTQSVAEAFTDIRREFGVRETE